MDPTALLTRWGVLLVFASVLLEQSGLPLPAPPLLIAAGALSQDGTVRADVVLVVAVIACLIADHLWFLAGRLRGRALLGLVCRRSLSPDTCVRQTDDLVARHGAPLLLVAKFIPGVSAVAIPTAAAMGLSYRRFLLFDGLGALLWSGSYIAAGMIFSRQVHRLMEALAAIGGAAMLLVALAFALYIAWKAAHRLRLKRLYRLKRIDPREAAELLRREPGLLFIDARSHLAREQDPRRFPNAIDHHEGDIVDRLPPDARERTLVTFCTCPNEASAALLAERLTQAGYSRVRVLTGGAEALAVLAR